MNPADWALKRVLRLVLRKFVGSFVKGGLDSSALDVQLARGSLSLSDVALDEQRLQDLLGVESPFEVCEASAASLAVQIPYTALSIASPRVHASGLRVAVRPRTAASPPQSSPADAPATTPPPSENVPTTSAPTNDDGDAEAASGWTWSSLVSAGASTVRGAVDGVAARLQSIASDVELTLSDITVTLDVPVDGDEQWRRVVVRLDKLASGPVAHASADRGAGARGRKLDVEGLTAVVRPSGSERDASPVLCGKEDETGEVEGARCCVNLTQGSGGGLVDLDVDLGTLAVSAQPADIQALAKVVSAVLNAVRGQHAAEADRTDAGTPALESGLTQAAGALQASVLDLSHSLAPDRSLLRAAVRSAIAEDAGGAAGDQGLSGTVFASVVFDDDVVGDDQAPPASDGDQRAQRVRVRVKAEDVRVVCGPCRGAFGAVGAEARVWGVEVGADVGGLEQRVEVAVSDVRAWALQGVSGGSGGVLGSLHGPYGHAEAMLALSESRGDEHTIVREAAPRWAAEARLEKVPALHLCGGLRVTCEVQRDVPGDWGAGVRDGNTALRFSRAGIGGRAGRLCVWWTPDTLRTLEATVAGAAAAWGSQPALRHQDSDGAAQAPARLFVDADVAVDDVVCCVAHPAHGVAAILRVRGATASFSAGNWAALGSTPAGTVALRRLAVLAVEATDRAAGGWTVPSQRQRSLPVLSATEMIVFVPGAEGGGLEEAERALAMGGSCMGCLDETPPAVELEMSLSGATSEQKISDRTWMRRWAAALAERRREGGCPDVPTSVQPFGPETNALWRAAEQRCALVVAGSLGCAALAARLDTLAAVMALTWELASVPPPDSNPPSPAPAARREAMLDVSLSASLHIHGGASTIASPDRDGCLLRTTSLRVRVLPALGRSPVSLALQATAGSVALYHSRSSIAGDAPAPRALLVEACGQGGGVPTSGGLDVLHVMTEAADGFLRSDTDVVLRGAGVDGGGVSGGCSFGWWSTVLAPLGRLPMAPGPRPVPDATSVRVAASGIALLVGVDGQGSRGGCFGGVLSSGSASWAMEFPGPDAGGTVTHAICLAPVALWVGSAAYWGAHAASQPDSKLWHLGAPTRRRGWSKVAQDDHLHATIASSPQGLSVSVRNSRTVASTAPEHLKYLVGVSTAVSGRHTPPDAQNGATAAPVAEPDGARAGAVPMSIPSTRLRGREKTHPRDLTGRSPPGAHALLPRGAAEPMLHRQAAGGAWAGEDPGGDIRPQWQTLSVLLDGTDVLATPPVPELHVDEAPPAVPDEGEDEVGFDEDWVNGGLFPDTPGGSSASSSASEVPSSLSGAAAPARRARGVEEAGSPWEGASFYAGAPEPDRRGSDRSRLSLEEQQSQRGMKGLLVIEDYLHEAACGASRSGYVEDELVQALAGPDEQGRWMTTARVGGGELQGRGSDVAGGDGAERPIDPGYLKPRRGAAQEPARRARGPTVGDFGQVCRECFKRAPLPDEEAGHTVEVGVGPWDLEWTLTGAREDSRDSAGGEASGDEWVLDDGEQAPAVLDDARDVLVSVQGFTLATLSAPLKLGGDGAEDPGGTPSDRLFRACIAAQEVAVRDLLHPTSSLWHMAVGRLAQGDQLPDNAPPIVHVAMAHGPPGSVGGTVHVALQPIRVSVDQGLVCFLARAAEAVRPKAGGGGDPESAGEESALPAQGGVSAWCPTRLHAERTTALVSYRPVRAVDPAGLIQGNVAEFLNVIPLKGVKLTLRDATVIGAEDVSAAAMEAGAAWLRDIGTRQAHVFVAGLPPMRPLWRLGTAATRVVTRPLRELRGDDASGDPPGGRAARTRAARRLREAGADFVRCVASEALGAGASIAHGVVTLVAPGNRGHRSGPRLGEQGGVSQAMREASERLAEGLDAAARAVVGEPVRRYRQGEGIASAAAAAARGLPAAAGRGIVAGLQAAEAAMRGASRALDNRRRQ